MMKHYGRPAAFVAAITALACATAPQNVSHIETKEPVVLTGMGGIIKGERPTSARLTAGVPAASAWKATFQIYDALGIPLTYQDPERHQLGNKDFWKSGKVGPLAMADAVDCGMGMTGRKADTYRIYMALVTTIDGQADTASILHTTLIAQGQDVRGGSADRIPCASTGALESVINESIVKQARQLASGSH